MIRLRKKASHKKVLRSEMKPLTSKIIRGITHQIRPSTSTSMGMHNFAAGIPHLCERASWLDAPMRGLRRFSGDLTVCLKTTTIKTQEMVSCQEHKGFFEA